MEGAVEVERMGQIRKDRGIESDPWDIESGKDGRRGGTGL